MFRIKHFILYSLFSYSKRDFNFFSSPISFKFCLRLRQILLKCSTLNPGRLYNLDKKNSLKEMLDDCSTQSTANIMSQMFYYLYRYILLYYRYSYIIIVI